MRSLSGCAFHVALRRDERRQHPVNAATPASTGGADRQADEDEVFRRVRPRHDDRHRRREQRQQHEEMTDVERPDRPLAFRPSAEER